MRPLTWIDKRQCREFCTSAHHKVIAIIVSSLSGSVFLYNYSTCSLNMHTAPHWFMNNCYNVVPDSVTVCHTIADDIVVIHKPMWRSVHTE